MRKIEVLELIRLMAFVGILHSRQFSGAASHFGFISLPHFVPRISRQFFVARSAEVFVLYRFHASLIPS
jgi:hypothetical protein